MAGFKKKQAQKKFDRKKKYAGKKNVPYQPSSEPEIEYKPSSDHNQIEACNGGD